MPRSAARILIFTTTYNERGNIGGLLDRIVEVVPDADILLLDDNSPDGTFDVVEKKKRQYPQLIGVRRPRKLGIGSAHKYALFYAMREGYDRVVTLDADHSHDPRFIPVLLAQSGPRIFVTGSRYCEGGTSSYRGYRALVSRTGNMLAKAVLGAPINELTTYYRCFDVPSLRSLPFRYINADGYGYGLQLIYYLMRSGIELREVPIDFPARVSGESKIPKLQVVMSACDLAVLALDKYVRGSGNLGPDIFADQACARCGEQMLAMQGDSPMFKCLHCNAVQKATRWNGLRGDVL